MHPTKTEEKYLEFEKLGRELGIPVPRVHIGVEVRDKNREIVQQFKDRSHSWNRNFYNKLYCFSAYLNSTGTATFGEGHLNRKRVAGSLYGISRASPEHDFTYAVGDDGGGVIIGTGSTAETFEDYTLETKINHGTAAGEMSYQASGVGTPTYTSGTKTWDVDLTRIFNNNSSGSIVIAEAGLSEEQYSQYYVYSRDILSSAVTVAEAGQLKITYTISMAFPS